MEAKTAVSPRVRLAAARWLSLTLLLWVISDESWHEVFAPIPIWQFGGSNPYGILVIATLSLVTLLILWPIVLHGPRDDSWLAALFAIFPLFMFIVSVGWVLSCPHWSTVIIVHQR